MRCSCSPEHPHALARQAELEAQPVETPRGRPGFVGLALQQGDSRRGAAAAPRAGRRPMPAGVDAPFVLEALDRGLGRLGARVVVQQELADVEADAAGAHHRDRRPTSARPVSASG